MSTRDRRRGDRTEQAIEAALQPGRFISHGAVSSFLDGLEEVAAHIAALVRPSPSRAVTLYETFIAGCYEKAEELDDSSGSFGSFVETEWEQVVRAVRADHRRKVGFMAGFEELVAGAGPSAKPSFLERAKARWARPRGG
jgi:hypothetical protein